MNREFIEFKSVAAVCGALFVFGLIILFQAGTSSLGSLLLYPLAILMIVSGPILFLRYWKRM